MTTLSTSSVTSVTGTETDNQFAGQLIGKDIPIFVGGQALMGCRIIEGPFVREVDGAGFVDMVVSCAMAASPGATRTITSLNLNGTRSWTLADGFIGSAFAGMVINFLYGTEDQVPLASSISRYGSRAVPYRSQIGVELKNIPLSVFANTIPFVSIYVHEADFITRNDALLALAKFARFDTSEVEISVSGHDAFWVVPQQSTFIEFLQGLQKTIGRNWNIVPGDKLRIFENPSTVVPITITRADCAEDTPKFQLADPLSIPAVRTMGFIDTTRDNDFNSVQAARRRFPVALTASEDTEQSDIPIAMAASDAKAIVNRSLLIDNIARNRFTCKLLPHMRGIQAGDIVFPNVDGNVDFELGRVVTVARNAADWTADIVVEQISRALLATAPSVTSNGGGATASVNVDEDTTAVTTVTADNADETGAFSIIGGADASLGTIDPDTGVLEFLVAPDFEVPTDADSNNVYEFVVQVTGNGLTDTQAISVTVANVADGGGPGTPMGLLLSLTYS